MATLNRPNGFCPYFTQGVLKLGPELVEGPLDAARPADQHMIGSGDPGLRKDRPGELPKTPLHPIANDGAPNLLGNGDAEANRRIAVAARTHEQHESGHGCAQAAVRSQIVGAASELC